MCHTKDATSLQILLEAGADTHPQGRPLLQTAVEINTRTAQDIAVTQALLQHRNPTQEEVDPALSAAVRLAMEAPNDPERELRCCIFDLVLRVAPGPQTQQQLAVGLAAQRESLTGRRLLGMLISDLALRSASSPGALNDALGAAVAAGMTWSGEMLLEASRITLTRTQTLRP